MSKQAARKNPSSIPASGTRPGAAKTSGRPTQQATASARPGAKSTRPLPATRGTVPRRPVTASRSRGRFKLRPLDIGLVVGGVALVGLIIWSSLSSGSQAVQGPGVEASPVPVGQAAPNFSLPDTADQTRSLTDYKEKVVLLEFMAPWCPHCQDDAPMFNQVAEQFKDKDVQFLAISATPYGRDRQKPIAMEDMIWFRDTYSVTFPMLFDKDVKAGSDYGVMFYPTVYILDKNGNVASMPTGNYTIGADGQPQSTRQTALTPEELAAEIDKALALK